MEIPVFVSCPTTLSQAQSSLRNSIIKILKKYSLEPRSLGRSDYPTQNPLQEVLAIARHCSGGIILGFKQFITDSGTWKPDTSEQEQVSGSICFPSPWNQLEAGILFSLKIPLLVFKEAEINGGIFDSGASKVFIHNMPINSITNEIIKQYEIIIQKWQGEVRKHYYIY